MHDLGAGARRLSAAPRAIQCIARPAPSTATGTSLRRRTRPSITAAIAGLRGASRWQIESRLTTPCALSARSSR